MVAAVAVRVLGVVRGRADVREEQAGEREEVVLRYGIWPRVARARGEKKVSALFLFLGIAAYPAVDRLRMRGQEEWRTRDCGWQLCTIRLSARSCVPRLAPPCLPFRPRAVTKNGTCLLIQRRHKERTRP